MFISLCLVRKILKRNNFAFSFNFLKHKLKERTCQNSTNSDFIIVVFGVAKTIR